MIRLKQILVASDFSETSEAALRYGRELARTFGAKFHVLHVADDVVLRYAQDGWVTLPSEIQADIENAAQTQLERCC
jgi:nucleotide-binding universal stress UspA family protein